MSEGAVRHSPRLQQRQQQQQQAQHSQLPASGTHTHVTPSPPPSHQHAAELSGRVSSRSPARPAMNISNLAVQAVHRQQALEWAQWGVSVMLLLWIFAVGCGYWNHADSDEKPSIELTSLPLLWFDRQVLRRFGAFLPLLVLALRYTSNIQALTIHGHRIPTSREAQLYGFITLTRLGVYFVHAAGYLQWVNSYFPAEVVFSDHMMSDHVFLTSSIATILMCEAVFILLHVRRTLNASASRGQSSSLVYVTAGLCAILYLLVVGDTYYSARYFHWRTHNNSAAVIGLLAFQLPALWMLGFGRPFLEWLLNVDNLRIPCPVVP